MYGASCCRPRPPELLHDAGHDLGHLAKQQQAAGVHIQSVHQVRRLATHMRQKAVDLFGCEDGARKRDDVRRSFDVG
jgi:hypothetical protein